MGIQHFSHEHPLALCDNKEGVCSGCYRSISGPSYACSECQYLIHKSCGELPQLIQHPFHSQHPLTLLPKAPYHSRNFECHACQETCHGFTFHCSECQFDLDTFCAELRPSAHDGNPEQHIQHLSHRHPLREVQCHEDFHTFLCNWCETSINGLVYICFDCKFFIHKSCAEQPQDVQIKHFSHKHPLALCYNDGACSACKNSISGPAYGCAQCRYFIHKSCGELPQVIQYPFHPRHPLTLLAKAPHRWRKFRCSVCKNRHSKFTYHCSECKFDMGVSCSKMRPSTHEENGNQQIKHFSHRHPLAAITFYGGSHSFRCSACGGIINGLAYICGKCKFILHKSCAELPRQIQNQFHPQHRLTLLAKAPYPSRTFDCFACERRCSYFTYHCFQCKLGLDIFCAALIRPITHNEEQIQHLSHHHPLFPVALKLEKYDSRVRCSLCGEYGGHFMYVCFECKYYIHMSCAKIPGEIRHPFHPQHLLTLLAKVPHGWKNLDCSACRIMCTSAAFHCSMCDFSLDFKCALVGPTTLREEEEEEEEEEKEKQQQQIQHYSHRHPLIPVTMLESGYTISCSVCRNPIKGSIYFCIKCKFFIHKSCTELPQEIQHLFHPEHPSLLLRLLPPPPDDRVCCSVCKQRCSGFTFQCTTCPFRTDSNCGMSMRTINHHGCSETQIQHFSHWHPLMQITVKAGAVRWFCSTCYQPLAGRLYVCIDCMFFLCKSCFELRQEIQNQVHPQHPALRIRAIGPDERCMCKVCGQSTSTYGLIYHCRECDFMICLRCESQPTIKYEHHEHRLFFMKMYHGYATLRCGTCGEKCTKCFLRCVECNLNLHVRCIPALPVTVKYERHKHPLTLTDPLTQDLSGEFYCNACETKRNPQHSMYYCAQCEFVAHIDCGRSEMVLSPDEASVACRLMDDGISISDDEMVISDLEEKEEETEEVEDEEEADHFNISELVDERVSKDLNKETTEEEQADQETEFTCSTEQEEETDAISEEDKEATQDSTITTDSAELEEEIDAVRKEMDVVREEINTLTIKLKALQQKKVAKTCTPPHHKLKCAQYVDEVSD